MNFTKAVLEVVVEEGTEETGSLSGASGSTALATLQNGKYDCSHYGRDGHTAYRFFTIRAVKCTARNFC